MTIIELGDEGRVVFEEMISHLQPKLDTWELRKESALSPPGPEIYPDRRKAYHNQREIKLNIKEFSLLAANKGQALTYGQMYQGVWKEEPFGNETIAVGSHVRSMRQKLYAVVPQPPFTISCILDIGYCMEVN